MGRKRNDRASARWLAGSWISLGDGRGAPAAGREAIFSLCPHHSVLFLLRPLPARPPCIRLRARPRALLLVPIGARRAPNENLSIAAAPRADLI